MGDLQIETSKWPLVQVGRVLCVNGDHPAAGKIAVIVEIIDHKRVLVDGPASDPELAVPRQSLPLAKCTLTKIVVEKLPRGVRHGALKKFWENANVESQWKESNWYKKRTQAERRKGLSDFDRFKAMRLKKQRRFEERKALAKVKASA